MNAYNQKTVYIFSPHPDDETLACGGTIIQRLSEGYAIKIVVMTDGSRSHSAMFGIELEPNPQELAEIRKKEIKNAATHLGLGAKDIIFLEAEDGRLSSIEDIMTDKVITLLKHESQNISEIFFPHETDSHPDHIATNYIVVQAVKQLKLSALLYRYKVYPSTEQDDADAGLKVQIDISKVLTNKVEAINQYKSQIGIFSKKQDKPVISSALRNGFCTCSVETFWRLQIH